MLDEEEEARAGALIVGQAKYQNQREDARKSDDFRQKVVKK